jgi:hypothetical protein
MFTIIVVSSKIREIFHQLLEEIYDLKRIKMIVFHSHRGTSEDKVFLVWC